MSLCKDFLREDEHVKFFMKVRNAAYAGKEMVQRWNGWMLWQIFALLGFVSSHLRWYLWAPGPREGKTGTAETLPAALQTVSCHGTILYFHWTLNKNSKGTFLFMSGCVKYPVRMTTIRVLNKKNTSKNKEQLVLYSHLFLTIHQWIYSEGEK